MASKITEQVEKLIMPYAKSLGFEVIEVEYEKKFNGMNLTVFIDKKGGIDINDCEKLHRLIDKPLDELNPTGDTPYILNVSSPGLDRPLKSEADFLRNTGKELEIKFYAPVDGKKEIEGELIDFKDKIITLKLKDGSMTDIKQENAAKVVLKINF